MRRMPTGALYLVLAAVVVSTMQSIWIGVTDTPRYQSVFPGARGYSGRELDCFKSGRSRSLPRRAPAA